jgi:hypothetical protein
MDARACALTRACVCVAQVDVTLEEREPLPPPAVLTLLSKE